jgi:hypothetical protein
MVPIDNEHRYATLFKPGEAVSMVVIADSRVLIAVGDLNKWMEGLALTDLRGRGYTVEMVT